MPFSNFSVSKNLARMVLPLKILPSSALTACKHELAPYHLTSLEDLRELTLSALN